MSDLKYDVFLSFRGDTRDDFTSHLHAELRRQNIETFIDYRIESGNGVSSALNNAIENSTIYVVILSEHYASSSWCLDELTEILKCKERYGREVIPVFYKVDPSNVRHQRQTYAEDLVKHRHRFGGKVDVWKAALTQVAGISGWDSKKTSPESTFVEKIAEDILKKLNRPVSSGYYEGLTGMDKHIEELQSMLQLESPTVRIIGIWGMGGIGKTTIANAIFDKLATQFDSRSIVNVQQEIKQHGGVSNVKRKFLSQLLGEKIKSSESNFSFHPRLRNTKVLLILDDLSGQLDDLIETRSLIQENIETHSKFGQGSRIIVTSRNKQVLKNAIVDESKIYEVTKMDSQDSLQLFCSFAFKLNNPKEPFVSLTKKVLDYVKGVPLALQVLGSLLYDKSKKDWDSQLQKLAKFPDLEIFNVLKLSYDGLDDEQKDIFLDIACFYRGKLVKVVELTLDSFSFSACKGMDDLKDRGLISISKGRVWMHDLIQEMGHEIVRLENKNDPGKRSRLWKAEDICDVLSKNKGTDAIQCIDLNIYEIRKVQPHADTFKKMHNLRMIKFYGHHWLRNNFTVTSHEFLKSFPNSLKFLQWDCFPQRSLPQDFCPENLVTLDMSYSHLEQLWEGDQALPNLKRLDLSYSKKLIAVPDLSFSPNIEEVILIECVSLTQVNSSSFLNNLNLLCLRGCTELKSLNIPSNILSRSSGLVALCDCHNLETLLISSRIDRVVQSFKKFDFYEEYYEFPPVMQNFLGEMEEINIELNDEGDYEIKESFSDTFSSKRMNDFCWLDISECESLTCLPAELLNLKFLTGLSLSGCLKLEELPEIKETMENLKVLILDKTSIKELPSSLHHLVELEKLSLQGCTKLKTIPSSIGNLSKLFKLDLDYCESLETFPSSIFKLKLTTLDFEGCSMLRTFPDIPNDSVCLSSLTELSLQGSSIVNLPESLAHLSSLRSLDLSECKLLECVPNNIGCLSSLTELSLQGSSIVNLPESMAHLSSLRSLYLSDCGSLECVPKLPPNLNKVWAINCPSIKRMMLNSRSDYEKDTFEFRLTNSEELDVTSLSNIEEEAHVKINDDAYRSVLFCFPGSAVPDWFYRCQGHSITIRNDHLNLYGRNRLIGFALCVVLGPDFPYQLSWWDPTLFRYRLKFESDGQTHFHPNNQLEVGYYDRRFAQHHTFLWKYELDWARIGNRLIDAETIITFEILDKHHRPLSFPTTMTVKECGICPLYSSKENDDDSIGEPSGDAACSLELSLSGNYTQNKRRKK